jgi:predicted nucleotidyltransferase
MPSADHGPFAAFLKTVIEALPQPTPAYCLIGALAVAAWGHVRSTRDIDLLVLSEEPGRTELIDSLMARGFARDSQWSEQNPLAKDVVLRLFHGSHPDLPLDLLFAVDAHSQSALARRRALNVLGISLWVCGPEDLVILKLKAGRPHDFEDALGIVKNPGLKLDFSYLDGWAKRLGLSEELQYVLNAER